jgi:hypothetical protein
MDVRFQKGAANLTRRFAHVLLRKDSPPSKAFENSFEARGQIFKQGASNDFGFHPNRGS